MQERRRVGERGVHVLGELWNTNLDDFTQVVDNLPKDVAVDLTGQIGPTEKKIMRQPGGQDRLDQTRLKRAPSDVEDEQDNSRPRLTYFAAVSQSLPDLAPRPSAWQQSNQVSVFPCSVGK